MKKVAVIVSVILLASLAWGIDHSIIDREDLSLKAGPTEPGEPISLVWLESYVYPKNVKEEKIISLGVRTTSKVDTVTASFDFSGEKMVLNSNDEMYWSGAFKIPDNVAPGLHVVRYDIQSGNAAIRRTVEFFVEKPMETAAEGERVTQGEAIYVQSWPLTVTSTCPALVGASSRILYKGEKVIGVSKVPWYKVIFSDGEEGWVSAAKVKEPLDEYYQLGYEAYRNKQYDAAAEYYRNTVAIKPDFVKGYFWLAKSLYRKGDLNGAYSAITEALRLDERNIDARVLAASMSKNYYDEAHAKLGQRRYNEAVAIYQKVLALKPNSAVSWIELGRCYNELGLPLEARSAWREALKVEPQNGEVLALLNIKSAPAALAQSAEKKIILPLVYNPAAKVMAKPSPDVPAVLADDSLEIVRETKTGKGTKIESALRSVIALTKSLGTPVVEKGWQAEKQGEKFLVSYLCEQGNGVLEAFEWLVDVDTKKVSAVNANSKLLMNRW